MTKVLYPGSFDPITKGHMDIIEQANALFDEVYVAVLQNSMKKNQFFTIDERVELIQKIYQDIDNIKVISGSGATVDLALLYECKAIIRGLRNVTDFEYEIQLAQINKEISNNSINSICLFANSTVQNVSSSNVKEIFFLNKPIGKYVEPVVEEAMIKKLRR